jgi:tetratricopeptide (TPR) repeat protein
LLGDAAVERGDYEAAFEHCQAALDQRPDLSSYARSAHLLWLTGDARRAKALMYRAIEAGGPHAENTAWCQAELALMMFHQGSIVPAEKQIERALARAPRNPHVLTVMGRIKAAQGDHPQAIRFYEQANAAAPRHAALAALTDLYTLTGEAEKAERRYQQVCELHARHSQAPEHSHDGEHAHDEAQAHGADQAHEDAMSRTIPGEVPHTHGSVELARFLADQDREPAKALREVEAAVQTLQSVHALDTLAWCYYRNGRLREAQETIRRALRWRTPDAAIPFHAGLIHAALGEPEQAKQYLYQALNLNPHFDPVQAKVAAETLKTLGRSVAPIPAP